MNKLHRYIATSKVGNKMYTWGFVTCSSYPTLTDAIDAAIERFGKKDSYGNCKE